MSNSASSAVRLVAVLAVVSLGLPAAAQTAEDELGSWWIYNGTLKFADHWSMFTEAQVRLYEVVSNTNEVFVRAAGQYEFSANALVALGYMRDKTFVFDESDPGEVESTEDRIYQQLTIRHHWSRAGFEHRYRLEQRWFDREGESDYSTRARYRLQVTTPLNRETMEPGAVFLNFYDELFVNLGSEPTFDQNRLYLAPGYQFNRDANIQVGGLWQSKKNASFYRLQIFLTYNFDFRRDPESEGSER